MLLNNSFHDVLQCLFVLLRQTRNFDHQLLKLRVVANAALSSSGHHEFFDRNAKRFSKFLQCLLPGLSMTTFVPTDVPFVYSNQIRKLSLRQVSLSPEPSYLATNFHRCFILISSVDFGKL